METLAGTHKLLSILIRTAVFSPRVCVSRTNHLGDLKRDLILCQSPDTPAGFTFINKRT